MPQTIQLPPYVVASSGRFIEQGSRSCVHDFPREGEDRSDPSSACYHWTCVKCPRQLCYQKAEEGPW